MEIGKKFKKAREEKGLSIDDIQEKTKIRKKYLCALENEEFDVIPGVVYARAFIKSYAQQLDLDEFEMIQEFQEWVAQNNNNNDDVEEEFEVEEFNYREFIKKYRKVIIAVIIIAFPLLIYNFIFLKNSNETSLDIAQNQEIMEEIEDENKLIQEHELQNDKNVEETIEIQDNSNKLEVDNNNYEKIQQKDYQEKEEMADVNIVENEDIDNIVRTGTNIERQNNNEDVIKDNEQFFTDKHTLNNNEKEVEKTEEKLKTEVLDEENKNKNIEKSEETQEEKLELKQEKQTATKISTLKIIGNGRSWIRIIIDDEKVFEGFINDGETMTYSGKEKMIIRVGNAIAVTVEKNGKMIGPLGKSGEVLTKEIEL